MKYDIFCGNGGHFAQACILANILLSASKDIDIRCTTTDSNLAESASFRVIRRVLVDLRHKTKKDNLFVIFLRFVKVLCICFFTIRKSSIVITTGPGLAIPVIMAAKLRGNKVVLVEDWCRFESHSPARRVASFLNVKCLLQVQQALRPNEVLIGCLLDD